MSDVGLGLVKYDAMILAIEACHSVDEVKEIRDKARAIEVYAAQALNRDAERQAAEIRIRAERKTGELLRQTKKNGERAAPAGNLKRGPKSAETTSETTLADLGISKDQSSDWQKLAEIPKEKFEEALANPYVMPSTAGILEAVIPVVRTPPAKYDKDALLAHGRVMDFQEVMHRPADELFALMYQFQRDEVTALLPSLIAWLKEMR
jgi:hypothetical protein